MHNGFWFRSICSLGLALWHSDVHSGSSLASPGIIACPGGVQGFWVNTGRAGSISRAEGDASRSRGLRGLKEGWGTGGSAGPNLQAKGGGLLMPKRGWGTGGRTVPRWRRARVTLKLVGGPIGGLGYRWEGRPKMAKSEGDSERIESGRGGSWGGLGYRWEGRPELVQDRG